MDTKSKNFRGILWAVSSAAGVIAAEAVCVFACALALVYNLKWNAGYWTTGEDGATEAWHSFNPSGTEPIISTVWMFVVGAAVIALVILIISLVTTGRKDENGKVVLNRFDRMFTDLQVLGLVGLFFLIALMTVVHLDFIAAGNWYENNVLTLLSEEELKLYQSEYGAFFAGSEFEPRWLEVGFAIVGNILLMGLFLLLLQSIVKKLKIGQFWKHTIIGKFCGYIYDAAKTSEGIFWKVMVVLVLGALISASWIGLIPVLVLIFIFVPKWVKKYEAVKEGVKQVKAGNLDYKIPVEDNGELDRLAAGINEISQAAGIAVQNELKNQRMKTDLISNVSHDLKTPLTSMVSYVDLLKTEGLDSENAPQYLSIIDEKTRRLQKLTEDLFEAAKASSGAIPVELNRLEMTSIVNQAMAELEERMTANGLDLIFTNKAEEVYVMADGQLLWRVIENLLVNVSKYALPHSRVYLDITETEGSVVLEIKNMSKDQLNISAEELMERFKRGDESRNTEGSGLGLSIAKDLTKLMGGFFEINIDGDLFKAVVTLKKAK